MPTKEIKCPGCQHPIILDVPEYPTAENIAEALAVKMPKTEHDTEHHNSVSEVLNHLSNCPTCSPDFHQFIRNIQQQTIDALSKDDVKKLARNQGFFPPASIIIDGSLLSRAR